MVKENEEFKKQQAQIMNISSNLFVLFSFRFQSQLLWNVVLLSYVT